MAALARDTSDTDDSAASLDARGSLARARQASSSQRGANGPRNAGSDLVDCPVPGCSATRAFQRTGIKTHITTKHREVAHIYPPAIDLPPSSRTHHSSTPIDAPNQTLHPLPSQPAEQDWAWADLQELHSSYLLHHFRPRILNHIPNAILPLARDALRIPLARINASPQAFGGWFTFFMFPLWCLRQDKDKSRALQYDTRRKLNLFIAGNWRQLQDELAHQMNPQGRSAETPTAQGSQDNGEDDELQRRIRRVKYLASKRELSRAAKALLPATPAEGTDATLQALQRLHPTPTEPLPSWLPSYCPTQTFTLDEQVLKSSLHHAPRMSAGGPSGWRFEHLKELCDPNDVAGLFPQLFAMCSHLSQGHASPWVCKALGMSRLLALLKPEPGGIRPIAIGEVLTRLIGRAIVVQIRDALQSILVPFQYGFAVPGGAEAVVHGIRAALAAQPDWVILKVDVANAFNSINRSSFFNALLENGEDLQGIIPFVRSLYGRETDLWYKMDCSLVSRIASANGTRQGDPLGGPLFALGHLGALKSTRSQHPSVHLPSIADDTYIIGTQAEVGKAFLTFKAELHKCGLQTKQEKCVLLLPPTVRTDLQEPSAGNSAFDGVSITHSGMKVLGCPVGDEEYTESFVDDYMIKKQQGLTMLPKLNDAQITHQLLLKCFNARPVYLIRCTPMITPNMLAHCMSYSDNIIHCMGTTLDILPGSLEQEQRRQMELPISKGGLGLTPLADMAPFAFLSSWAASAHLISVMFSEHPAIVQFLRDPSYTPLTVCHEQAESITSNVPSFSDMVAGPYTNIQATCMEKMAQTKMDSLISSASSSHDKARLYSVTQKFAGLWLADGVICWKAKWSHEDFKTALRLRLGLPHPPMQDIFLCTCGKEVDRLGYHHLHCPMDSDVIIAHNAVRDSIGRLCRTAGYSVRWESRNEVPRRHGEKKVITDLVLHRDGIKTLMDITIRNPCCPSLLPRASRTPLAAASKGEAEKIRKYSRRMLPQDHFVPAAFEPFGAWGETFGKFFGAVARSSQGILLNNTGSNQVHTRMFSKVSNALAQAVAKHLNAKFERVRLAQLPSPRREVDSSQAALIHSLLAA